MGNPEFVAKWDRSPGSLGTRGRNWLLKRGQFMGLNQWILSLISGSVIIGMNCRAPGWCHKIR